MLFDFKIADGFRGPLVSFILCIILMWLILHNITDEIWVLHHNTSNHGLLRYINVEKLYYFWVIIKIRLIFLCTRYEYNIPTFTISDLETKVRATINIRIKNNKEPLIILPFDKKYKIFNGTQHRNTILYYHASVARCIFKLHYTISSYTYV